MNRCKCTDGDYRSGIGLVRVCQFFSENISSFMCDLSLQPTQTNVSNGTTTPQGEHLCKIILKSMHKCRSYGSDRLIYAELQITF